MAGAAANVNIASKRLRIFVLPFEKKHYHILKAIGAKNGIQVSSACPIDAHGGQLLAPAPKNAPVDNAGGVGAHPSAAALAP
jgi:hypothetical protein